MLCSVPVCNRFTTEQIRTETEKWNGGTGRTETEQTETSGELNDEDVENFTVANRNKNNKSDLNVFYRWVKSVNETRTLENIPELELDKMFVHFFKKFANKTEKTMNLTHLP